jgi:hypothetical protein
LRQQPGLDAPPPVSNDCIIDRHASGGEWAQEAQGPSSDNRSVMRT